MLYDNLKLLGGFLQEWHSPSSFDVLVIEENMARRWSSLSRRAVRSSLDDPFLLRTHVGISVHLLHLLRGEKMLTWVGV